MRLVQTLHHYCTYWVGFSVEWRCWWWRWGWSRYRNKGSLGKQCLIWGLIVNITHCLLLLFLLCGNDFVVFLRFFFDFLFLIFLLISCVIFFNTSCLLCRFSGTILIWRLLTYLAISYRLTGRLFWCGIWLSSCLLFYYFFICFSWFLRTWLFIRLVIHFFRWSGFFCLRCWLFHLLFWGCRLVLGGLFRFIVWSFMTILFDIFFNLIRFYILCVLTF